MYILLILSLFFSCFVEPKIIYSGDSNSNKIYLTFDDGYSLKNTYKILDILKEKDVPACFFVHGDFLVNNINAIKRISTEQMLGNHTMCHKDIRKLSDSEFTSDINEFEAESYRITGIKPLKVFRPPMGFIDKRKATILSDNGYMVFKWNCCCYDYNIYDDLGKEYVVRSIVNGTKNGSIILMHTMTKSNVEALPTIIDKLREKYVFSSLKDFIHNQQ